MKIIVTGGAGFIGHHLVRALTDQGHTVFVIDNLSTGKVENLDLNKVVLHEHDLGQDNLVWHGVMSSHHQWEEIDYVVHLAALPRVQRSIENPMETHRANVTGTLNALLLARELNAKFIYASSSSVYGDHDREDLPLKEGASKYPQNPYATQKLIGEKYCEIFSHVYGLNTFMLRFFNVYGREMATEGAYKLVFGNWIEQIQAGKRITIYGDGEQTRDFTHVSDVVDAIMTIVNENIGVSGAYNICSGVETSINELAKLFNWGVDHVENPRPQEEMYKQGDNHLMKNMFNWEPKVSLKEGIEDLKEFYGI